MPRRDRDDDYDDEYDDRPRRRAGNSNKGTWIILGVVGGTILLIVAGCAVGIGFLVNRASNAVNQMTQTFAAQAAAESFLEEVKRGRGPAAYDTASLGLRQGQTRDQFQQFVTQNPILTKHQYRSVMTFNAVEGTPRTVVVHFTLHADPPAWDQNQNNDWPEDDPPPGMKQKKPAGKVKEKEKEKKEPALTDTGCTVTMIEEGGAWKVDKITIP